MAAIASVTVGRALPLLDNVDFKIWHLSWNSHLDIILETWFGWKWMKREVISTCFVQFAISLYYLAMVGHGLSIVSLIICLIIFSYFKWVIFCPFTSCRQSEWVWPFVFCRWPPRVTILMNYVEKLPVMWIAAYFLFAHHKFISFQLFDRQTHVCHKLPPKPWLKAMSYFKSRKHIEVTHHDCLKSFVCRGRG